MPSENMLSLFTVATRDFWKLDKAMAWLDEAPFSQIGEFANIMALPFGTVYPHQTCLLKEHLIFWFKNFNLE